MSDSSIQLDYAKPPPWHRRRWFRRVLFGATLIALAAITWRWGPEKWERAKLLYWQRQCMNYAPPADQIVYDQDPRGTSALLSRPEYVPWDVNQFPGEPLTAAAKVPECVNRFNSLLDDGWGPKRKYDEPILFMHERTAPSGRSYLIILKGAWPYGAVRTIGQLFFDYDTYKPGDWNHDPESANGFFQSSGGIISIAEPPAKRLGVYAGQVDPNDASHFTIRYEQNGKVSTVDGYVDDTEDEISRVLPGPVRWRARVKISERNPPPDSR